ncbi:MAG: PqqD family protein [Candidatus Velthaea sp.]
MIATDRCLLFRPDVVATVLEDGAVLLDLETKLFYELNRTGWEIASMFERGVNGEIVRAQCRAWGAPPHDDAAIDAVLRTLVEDGLVTATPDAPATDTAALSGNWVTPTIVRQAEPLQRIIISAFDPSVPLVE